MDTVFAERPHFFEGQYLGADDLGTLLEYLREQSARERLAWRSWGVVSGIEIVQRSDPAGAIEYLLTPGVAIDGYGRLIAVLSPTRLDAGLFALQPSGLVNVWIRHLEASAGGVRRGFEVCDATDAYSRVSEGFAIEVGLRNTLAQRQSGVEVAGTTYPDARDALGTSLPGQPVALDGSVGAQLFPTEDDPSRWLIPVGRVAWSQGAPGQLLAADDTTNKLSMIVRRQAGVVTESIIASGGLLRLRARWTERVAGQSNDQLAAAQAPLESDLQNCHGRIQPAEPIWIEEHTRLTGDLRLLGQRIEWQAAAGTDYANQGVVMALRRRVEANALKGEDLQLLLGAALLGPNRLVIGQGTLQAAAADPCRSDFDFTPGVVVQQDARVGIGTIDSPLLHPLTLRASGAQGQALALQSAAGGLAWQINTIPGATGFNITQLDATLTNLFIAPTGNVGISTSTPEAKLDIRAVPAPQGNALGAAKWLQVGDGGDAGRMWLQYGSQLAPLMVLSDFDDPSRIQFQQIGTGTEQAPQFQSWVGQARSNSADLALSGGRVGIGTLVPQRLLHVEGDEIHSGGVAGGMSFSSRNAAFVSGPANGERWVLYADDGVARLWSGNDKLAVNSAGNVGIGTTFPAERLDVRGNVRIGVGANYFAVGAPDNQRMLSGSVPAIGITAGNGWLCAHPVFGSGQYFVSFIPGFSATPVVTVTVVDPPASDNVICVRSVSAAGFTVEIRDIIHPVIGDNTEPQDSAFNFIAVGPRA